mmetsp:Transcript_6013/g.12446  ORF Transcript_6013/g.12446 Transcript_6013/m.12446 type:complete len:129 (-) Transcript_6013:101-487(-)
MKFGKLLFGRLRKATVAKPQEGLPVRIRTINSDDATYDSSHSSKVEETTDADDMMTNDSATNAAKRGRDIHDSRRNHVSFRSFSKERKRVRYYDEDNTLADTTLADTAMTSKQTIDLGPEIYCCGVYL